MTMDERLKITNKTYNKENSSLIFNKLIEKICKDSKKDKTFILLLMFILKNKKSSNDLILALFYTFL